MDFQCDRCGQKYHVADEKLQARTASRFKCKKCENIILLPPVGGPATGSSPMAVASPKPASPLRAPTAAAPLRASPQAGAALNRPPVAGTAPAPAPRPRPLTTAGPAYGAGPRPAPAVAARPSVAPEPADEAGWFAGIRDLPVGPITRAELKAYVDNGDANGETLVWRDGFADWRPLRLVPALKELAPPLRVVSQRPPSATPAPVFTQDDGDATTVTSGAALLAGALAEGPAAPRAEVQPEAPTRRLSALTDEHLRSIRLPPVTGEKPAAKAPVAPATPKSVAPPAPAARSVAPPATPKSVAPPSPAPVKHAPPAAPATGSSLRATPAPPAPTRKLEPLAPRRPSAPPPSPRAADALSSPRPVAEHAPAAHPHPAPSEAADASFAPSLDELDLTARSLALSPPPPAPAAEVEVAPAPAAKATSSAPPAPAPAAASHEGWEDPVFRATEAPAPPGANGAWADPVFNSMAPPAPTAPKAVALAPADPAALRPSQVGVTTGPLAVAVDVVQPKPRGLPKSAWVMAAGFALVGVAGGIAMSRQGPARPAAPSPAPSAAPAPTAPEQPVAAPENPVAAAPGADPNAQASPDMTFSPDGTGNRERRHHSGGARPAPTAEQNAARQAQLERMLGIGAGGPAPQVPSTPTGPRASSNGVAAPAQQAPQQQAAVANASTGGVRSVVREREAVDLVERSGVVRRCWDQLRLRNPGAAARRLSISVGVNADGRVTVRVPDRSDESLASCIENRAASIRSMGPGAAAQTSVGVSLD